MLIGILLLAAWSAVELVRAERRAVDPRDEAAGYDRGEDDMGRNMALAGLTILGLGGAVPAAAVLLAARLRRRGPSLAALGLLALTALAAWTAAIRDGFDGSWGLVALLLVYPLTLALACAPASLRHLGVIDRATT